MSSVAHPKGPLPPQVYWRRRLIVIGVIVLIIVVIVIIVVARGGGGSPTPGSSQTPGPSSTAGADATPGGDCDPSKLELTADMDKDDYASGEQPQLWFAITSHATASCTLNVVPTSVVYTISSASGSGQETYWTSADCAGNATPAPSQPVTLKPGVPVESSTKATWNLTRSSAGDCTGTGQTPLTFDSQVSFTFTVALDSLSATKQFFIE